MSARTATTQVSTFNPLPVTGASTPPANAENVGYSVCDTKAFFDTEFEATIFAAKRSYKYNQEFEPYHCRHGNHWHITHTDPLKRRGYGKKFWRCPKCKLFVKTKDAPKHKCS